MTTPDTGHDAEQYLSGLSMVDDIAIDVDPLAIGIELNLIALVASIDWKIV